jgi:hypothetical protein
MKVLENGDYLLDDGTVVPASEIGKLYEKTPKPKSAEKDELSEGQCSGPIRLED